MYIIYIFVCIYIYTHIYNTTRRFCIVLSKNGSSQGHNLAVTVLYVPSSLDSTSSDPGLGEGEAPLNTQPSTLNPQPSTLNPQPSTLNPQRSTLNTQPSTLNTQHSTLNTQHSTLNTQHSTPKTQDSTLNPRPAVERRDAEPHPPAAMIRLR